MAKKAAKKKAARSAGTAASVPKPDQSPPATERRHPRYIVVFQSRSPQNVTAVSKALNVGEAAGKGVRSSCTILKRNHEWAAEPRVYERLGVAAVDLSPDEKLKLSRSDAVEMIVENEVRQVPPLFEEVAERSEERWGGDLGPETFTSTATTSDAELVSYLTGMRDAADALLRRMQSRRESPRVQISSSLKHSWCLDMIGIGDSYSGPTGKGVRVAVLDTGIDLEHPDFAGMFPGGNNTESFVSGESVQDGHGHGTHCAGIVGARVPSAGGRRYSVAPDVELVIGKVLSNAGTGSDDDILDGIDWAVDSGARVVSLSLGSRRLIGKPHAVAYEAVARNLLGLDPGVLLVAAAGNGSARPSFMMPVENPAACPSIWAVAAIDSARRIADFSNPKMDEVGSVEFSAPGVAVYSAWTGGGYRTNSGTSMATPHVAGIAALVSEELGDASAQAILDRVRSLCVPIGNPADFGRGLVQASLQTRRTR